MKTGRCFTPVRWGVLAIAAIVMCGCKEGTAPEITKGSDQQENGNLSEEELNKLPIGGKLPIGEQFIWSYIDTPTQEQVQIKTSNDENRYISPFILCHDGTVNEIHELYGHYGHTGQDYANAKKYEELYKKFDDVDYEQRIEQSTLGTLTGYNHVQRCLYRRTESIHVVSDTDYDAQHPAGTLLDELIDISFDSAEDFMQGGYRLGKYLGRTTRQHRTAGKTDNVWLTENLAEFNTIKRTLIAFDFCFDLAVKPEQTGTHRFTITYTNEDGTVLTGTTEPIVVHR